MATKTIKQMDADARALVLEAKSIYDKGDDATPEELQEAATKTTEAEAIASRLDELRGNETSETGRLANLKTINRIENSLAVLQQPDRPLLGGDGTAVSRQGQTYTTSLKTAGELFAANADFQAWTKAIAPHGAMPYNAYVSSPTIEVKTLYTLAGDSSASRPLLGQADRRNEIIPLNWPERFLRDLVTNLTTTSDLVEAPRELSRTNNAAFVAEASATSGSSGEKPESAISFELVQAAVQTLAHWIPASTRVLADARLLQQVIDAFLREGLNQALEAAMLTGNGTSPNIRGVNNTTGILTQSFDTSILKTTRKARTKLKVTGREARPNAWVFHPNDWETVDLLTDGETRYYFGGPLILGMPRLWGIQVLESEFQTEGFTTLGNWKQAVVYDREQTGIRIANQHADFFVRNLVAILAEMRLAFMVQRPSSFIYTDIVA